MTAYETLQNARLPSRPTARAYIQGLFRNPMELHGDRAAGDDGAISAGLAWLGDVPVTYAAIEKGSDMDSRLSCNFGCPRPEGYRKVLRLVRQAEKFRRPVIMLVDTSGASCDEDAERRGQGFAIANNLAELMAVKTPIISVIIGEGGSGGALAMAVADRVLMLEGAVYSVISPEGCASILWKDSARAPEAAESLCITAAHMKRLGVADELVPETGVRFSSTLRSLHDQLTEALVSLRELDGDALIARRYARYRRLGEYDEL